MVKIDELNEDNVKGMSLEELQKVALEGKWALLSARGVIWELNKKVKGWNDGGDDKDWTIKKEDLPNYLKEIEGKKAMDNFIANNPVFEDHKDDLEKAMNSWLFASVDEASAFMLSKDETLRNNVSTNQGWIKWGQWGWATTFNKKVDLETYESYSQEEQEAYDKFSNENFGWFILDDPQSSDD